MNFFTVIYFPCIGAPNCDTLLIVRQFDRLSQCDGFLYYGMVYFHSWDGLRLWAIHVHCDILPHTNEIMHQDGVPYCDGLSHHKSIVICFPTMMDIFTVMCFTNVKDFPTVIQFQLP